MNDPIDLVLCDLGAPGIDDHQFLAMLHERAEFAEIPIIALTSDQGVETKIKVLNAGASDYLIKPFCDEELVARVKIHLQIKKLLDALQEKKREIRRVIPNGRFDKSIKSASFDGSLGPRVP